jgi:UDP-N-acetylmuramoylalanine--D-glutamate ligase
MSEAVLGPACRADAVAVVEISSFQAELPGDLELDALLWTNFAEDHLDRYATMHDYLAAKANLLSCLKPGATVVFGSGLREQLDAAGLAPLPGEVASDPLMPAGLYPEGALSRLPHRHNFEMVASYWQQKRCPGAALLEAAAAFELSPHRLQQVAEKAGVCFWDDSKATNFEAALAAVAALDRPIVWIGGGQAKGGDVAGFSRAIGVRVDAAVVYGEAAEALAANLPKALDPVRVCPQFEEAVGTACRLASTMPGAQVLLSPGFASFDQFASYAERGKSFISIVLGLSRSL